MQCRIIWESSYSEPLLYFKGRSIDRDIVRVEYQYIDLQKFIILFADLLVIWLDQGPWNGYPADKDASGQSMLIIFYQQVT